ncbi:histidinol phosphate aminotransferase [Pseudophaeobacter flagellatus]|uniref:histidinol phosphate aminotransferase n=1 Tax=Pseudophaeobacter flagellatus TaxID=2899119 RepID=UPI001E63927C|nr:histidinol phosphate aminotransferase [Pseudophaeobacter flagellatus]MCD9149466.1 histidinol phosphate aminotransferase [Pseudophaeobacter flagellatus]
MRSDKGNNPPHGVRQQPEASLDLFANALSFIGLNLIWLFFAVWMLFGMVPVLFFALLLNHMINRLEDRIAQEQS